MTDTSFDFLRKHIARSLELANKITDGEIASHLRQMAVDYQRVLDDLEAKAAKRSEDHR